MKMINAEAFKRRILNTPGSDQWDIQEVIKQLEAFPKATTKEVHDGEVIILGFTADDAVEDLEYLVKALSEEFPNNKVIAVSDDITLITESRENAICMLEDIIAKLGET